MSFWDYGTHQLLPEDSYPQLIDKETEVQRSSDVLPRGQGQKQDQSLCLPPNSVLFFAAIWEEASE